MVEVFTVSMDKDMHDRLEHAAEKLGISRNEIARRAIKEYLDKNQEAFQ